jgi:hypothetical protein
MAFMLGNNTVVLLSLSHAAVKVAVRTGKIVVEVE